jgi:hypothetical protein
MSLKKRIQESSSYIVDLYRDGLNRSEIARALIQRLGLEYSENREDYVRKEVSRVLTSPDPEVSLHTEGLSEEEIELNAELNEVLGEEDDIEEISSDLEYKEMYHYDESSDTYFFFFQNPPIRMTGTLIREMKESYSNMTGSPLSINQICRKFEIPRYVFVKVKRILGWTHDDDPFTDEEYINGDVNEMADRALQRKKFNLYQSFNAKQEREILKAAQQWYSFKGGIVNPFLEKAGNFSKEYKVPSFKFSDKISSDRYAMVIAPFDFHYGKYAWSGEVASGEEYNREIARNLLKESVENIAKHIRFYDIEKIIVPIGSDFYHVDTVSHTTTKGTPQDVDGTYVQIATEGNKLMIEFIDTLRQFAHVEISLCAGNHDFKLSHALLEYLAAWYRNNEDVTVHEKRRFRNYTTYGNTLIGFTHGDKTKLTELPRLMANEAKHDWASCKYRAFFHGHLHHEVIRDIQGVKLYQMPSLSGSDRWHHEHGWEGSVRSLAAYLIHHDNGVECNIFSNV